MMEKLSITIGANGKPVATDSLNQCLSKMSGIEGEVFTGYPLIATPEGKYSIDATMVSPSLGIVLFDLVEGTDAGDYHARQDDLANKMEARLRLHRQLLHGRTLMVPISVVSFAPAIESQPLNDDYPMLNEGNLSTFLANLSWKNGEELYRLVLSSIENLSSIRHSRVKREVQRDDSLGTRLKKLEDSIATLDHRQNKAVIETVDGVQRIRGLAGSGKTIVLALKAAYLHEQHPHWRIAVTFNTRSLKGQFLRLIRSFCLQQGGEEPDWNKIRVVNAWGAPGGPARDGIYYEYCRSTGAEFHDFKSASTRFGGYENAFDGACRQALATSASALSNPYDLILVDEAQDFAPSFLRLCYSMLKPSKRLVYAYDELQSLSGESLPSPEEIFGQDENGQPLVTFGDDRRRDVILQKCYRNSRPVLVSAHGLGFGIYRQPSGDSHSGLVQMFDHPSLWQEIGYTVRDGELAKGQQVVLERTNETSPRWLENLATGNEENHSEINQLVQFIVFPDEEEQNKWVVSQIKKNLEADELLHEDIIVIHPDPKTARASTGPIRKMLFDSKIQTHLAGVDTDADVFFRNDLQSVTFTGIHRAKGNEAGMVYVVNAQDCNSAGAGLATLRNRLFTAMTRSKAWVRVVGYGPKMDSLVKEFEAVKDSGFVLDFVYPDDSILSKLRIVHRDLSPAELRKLERSKSQMDELIQDLERGDLHPDDLDQVTRERLLKLLSAEKR